MAFDATDQKLSFAAPRWPLDKIYYKPPQGSVAVSQSASPIPPYTFTEVTTSNPKNENFFISMQISPDNDVWYDTGLEPSYYEAALASSFKRFIGIWHMNTTTITLGFVAIDAPYTLYYRLVGYSKD